MTPSTNVIHSKNELPSLEIYVKSIIMFLLQSLKYKGTTSEYNLAAQTSFYPELQFYTHQFTQAERQEKATD